MIISSCNRYFIKLVYNGKNYFGWQIQKNEVSVQEVVNQALSTILKKEINVVGCGRTDTGVHAKEFFAHFDLDIKFSIEELNSITKKLNGFLPVDISIHSIFHVNSDAHTRFDAISRTYKYYISQKKDPFSQDFAFQFHPKLDIKKMNTAAAVLLDYFDFTSFSKVKTQVKTNNCKISKAHWDYEGHILVFTITADRFLRNMVRAIVGTLLDIGQGKTTIEDLKSIIESKNRSNAGYSVPAHGLFLTEVTYPLNITAT